MKTAMLTLITTAAIIFAAVAQSPMKEYIDDKGEAKIKKSIVVEHRPIGNKSFSDGHGNQPYITSKDQLPKKIALVTFYVFDNGTTDIGEVFITTHNLSEAGGNFFANNFLNASLAAMKESFAGNGIQLLTIKEALDSKEKQDFYYKQFAPQVSRFGKFLSGLESGRANMAVAADNYRGLDVNAAGDCLRAESLGGELGEKLGVDAVLSIALELQHDGKKISLNTIRWAIDGRNPIPKEDKKYIGQNTCTGYYKGQVYFKSYCYIDKPIVFAKTSKKELTEEKYEGFETLLKFHVDKTIETWMEALK